MVLQFHRYIIQLILLISLGLGLILFQLPDDNLHIIACDVGQGDAILVTYKNIQILTDGGANNKVLDCLGKYVPVIDREIELVILTHPDRDHYYGLIEVFRRYKVDNFLYNRVDVSSPDYQLLEKEVGSSGVSILTPAIGKSIRLGLIQLDIVYPDKDFKTEETNAYSINYYLIFGNFKAIFTGDITESGEKEILNNNFLQSVDYIKIPHHGSRNNLEEKFLNALMPKVAVISAGKENRYGHPHREVLEMLDRYKVKVYRTDLEGDIEIVTDGEESWKNN